MADLNSPNDSITISQVELENLVGKLVKRYRKQDSASKSEVKRPLLINEEPIENGQYNYQNYERRLNLIERIIRLEEGQKHILDKIETQFKASNQRFEDMNKRFDDMNKRFDDMNKRLNDMNESFNQRFEDMNKRFDQRFEGMNKRFNQRFEDMNKSFNQRFEDTNKRLDDMNKNFNQRFLSLQWFITVGFTVLGLLTVLLKLWDK